MTNGDPKETTKKTAKPFDSGCIPLLTGGGFILLSLFAPVMAIYGLVTGQTGYFSSRDSTGEGHWYSRVKEPGAYWLTEAVWLLLGVLSLAFWGYVLWSLRRPDKKSATPSGEQIVPKPPDRGREP